MPLCDDGRRKMSLWALIFDFDEFRICRKLGRLYVGSAVTEFLMPLRRWLIHLAVFLASASVCRADDVATSVSPATTGADRILTHLVRSPFQAGDTTIRVLLPDTLEPSRRYPIVYVLPVEARDETHYGEGLAEVQKQNLQNRSAAIFVEPTFSQLPWYADHPSDPRIRQETYFLQVVLPFIEKTYPARQDPGGRLLLGFSKSGWGAFSLLLRHPDLFGKAAAWDAPLMMDAPGKYGSGPIFGTRDNFENYQISRLLQHRAADLHTGGRLILLGYGNFRGECLQADALMQSLQIDHIFHDGPHRAHTWSSGWLPEAVDLLLPRSNPAATTKPAAPK
jgi:hypothetical protein